MQTHIYTPLYVEILSINSWAYTQNSELFCTGLYRICPWNLIKGDHEHRELYAYGGLRVYFYTNIYSKSCIKGLYLLCNTII